MSAAWVVSRAERHPVLTAACCVGAVTGYFTPHPAIVWMLVLSCVGLLLGTVADDDAPGDDGGPPPLQEASLPAMPDEPAHRTESELRSLTDQDLCQAWRRSYVRLRRLQQHPGGTRAAVLAMTAQRALFLDELERRYPAGFAAWIAAGARAPSDPMPYLRPPGPHRGAA